MQLFPLTNLKWAYQLHYLIAFWTHRRRVCFGSEERAAALTASLAEVCQRHDYHLLKSKVYPDHLRCLISIRPDQVLASVIQTIKTNSSRECNKQLGLSAPVWARGYLARSVGRVSTSTVKEYLQHQSEHHGYARRVKAPIFRYRASERVCMLGAHAAFELNHHVVMATRYRRGVFGSQLGSALGNYWLRVAAKYGFAIDQIAIVPDHVHLLLRIVPKMSIAKCVTALMNNGQHYVGRHQSAALIEVGIDQLWQPSAYAGTRGNYTTALIKHWLNQID